ncbi:hypothetical protein H2248_004739 [Termitomyces sp. 'cryptogamus']|nr:hypothetical protein H2248_004739 [Termitomyces sp. 'cryptogamus']
MYPFLFPLAFGLAIIYFIALAVYRLFYHPLSKFPGPRLAAITDLYSAYYDLVLDGVLLDHLEHLHRTYGPVVRISPEQLHFNDPDAFNHIYSTGSKFTKLQDFYDAFNEKQSSFGYIDVKKAKQRKDVMRPLFSRRAILSLENVIQNTVDQLVAALLLQSLPGGKPVNLHLGYLSTSMEIIMSYCFARSCGAVSTPSFRHPTLVALQSTGRIFSVMQHFPFTALFITKMPMWLARIVSPEAYAYGRLMRDLTAQIDELLEDPSKLEHADHEIIYHHLLTPKEGQIVPSRQSLIDEASVMIFAGSDTIRNACSLGTFHVLSNPEIHAKLINELRDTWPDRDVKVGLERLEKLPYLTAVIKESLRLSHGVVTPLPRVVPSDTVIAGKVTPQNAIVSMGATFMHQNTQIFKEPLRFRPERWLSDERVPGMDDYLVPFSRGPRSCLGLNLAWAELYLIFANVFRKVDIEIYNTTIEDFKVMAFFLPKYSGRPLHVLVKGKRADEP